MLHDFGVTLADEIQAEPVTTTDLIEVLEAAADELSLAERIAGELNFDTVKIRLQSLRSGLRALANELPI